MGLKSLHFVELLQYLWRGASYTRFSPGKFKAERMGVSKAEFVITTIILAATSEVLCMSIKGLGALIYGDNNDIHAHVYVQYKPSPSPPPHAYAPSLL